MKACTCIAAATLLLAAAAVQAQDVEAKLSGNTAAQGFTVKDAGGNGLMTVRGDGNVGIGTATPAAALDVRQDGTAAAAYFHIDYTTSASPVLAVETSSTNYTTAAIRASAQAGNAVFGESNGAVTTAYFQNDASGSAVIGVNNSSSQAAIRAININSSSGNAPVLAAYNGSADVFVVDRDGDVTATGAVSADAFTAGTSLNSGFPAAGGIYRDNVVYAWGKVLSNGSFMGHSFGIQGVSVNSDTTFTITFKTTFSSVDDYAIVVSPINNSSFEIATPLPVSANSAKVKIQAVTFSPANILRRDVYDDFYIIVTGNP